MTEKAKAKPNSPNRPKRIPLGTRNVLTAEKKPGYVRRFVNDEGDRVAQFEAAGYEVVREKMDVGDPKAGQSSQLGNVVRPPVGAGTSAVLMEIKEEYYEEDQKAKQDRIDAGEKDMRANLNSGREGTYGNVDIQ